MLGIATGKIRLLDELISPLLSIIKATPVASFIILALFWLTKESIPSFIAFLMVLPIIHGNVSEGIKNTPNELIEMTRIYDVKPLHRLTKLYIPNILPYFVAGFKTSLGLAWKAGVAAEVIALTKNSIGKELYEAKNYLETVDLFTWTLTVIVISRVLEKLLMMMVNSFTQKRKRGSAK
jgi:NitT/TauT family transport system permease protein